MTLAEEPPVTVGPPATEGGQSEPLPLPDVLPETAPDEAPVEPEAPDAVPELPELPDALAAPERPAMVPESSPVDALTSLPDSADASGSAPDVADDPLAVDGLSEAAPLASVAGASDASAKVPPDEDPAALPEAAASPLDPVPGSTADDELHALLNTPNTAPAATSLRTDRWAPIGVVILPEQQGIRVDAS